MSDKNLTSKEWLKFSAGKAYKDTAFAKALAAVDKGSQGPASAQLEGLEELRAQARALLKVYKADKALDGWLADLELSAKKRALVLEKSAAQAQAPGDEDDSGSALTDPKRLLQQLTLLRRDPDRTAQFAYVDGVGKAPGVLTVSPKVAGRKLFALLADQTGSKLGAFGAIWVDGSDLILQLDKPMSGLVKKLRVPVKACGFKARNIVLMSDDGSVFEKDADAQDDGEPAAAAAADDAALVARLKTLVPRVTALAASPESKAAKLLASEAGVFLRKGDLAKAGELLSKAEALMARLDGPAAAGAKVAPKVLYTQTRLAWDGVRKHVQAELRKVEAAVLAESANEPDFSVIQGNVKMLYTVLDRLDDRLIDVLDEALNAEVDAQRKAHQKQALGLVDEYLAYVNSGDPFLEAIDDNGFVDVQLLSVLSQRLADMRAQLSAAVAA